RPGQVERRLEVEVDDLVPAVGGELFQGGTPVGAGVVDQDVDALFETADLRGQPQALLLAGQVGGHRDHGAVLGELGGRGVARLGLARADVDRGAGLEQAARHHHGDPAGGAGDDANLAAEVERVQECHPVTGGVRL